MLDSIKNQADVQIAALKTKAESYFTELAFEYLAASEADRVDIMAAGISKLAQFDNEFAGIMSTLRSQLSSNGFDTSIAGTLARSFLGL